MSICSSSKRIFASACLFFFVWFSVVIPVCVYSQETVELASGKRVMCAFTNVVDPNFFTVGQRITLRVSESVKVDNVIVIEEGAPVIGEVTHSQKKGSIGKPAIIGVRLYSVTAIDGSEIALSGQKLIEGENKQTSSLVITILCCVLGLLQKGGDAVIPAGAQVEGTVVGTTKISV